MKNNFNRREFVRTATVGGIGFGIAGSVSSLYGKDNMQGGKIGIIAFMQAAEESKLKGGVPIEIEKVRQKAIQQAKKIRY